MSESPPRSQRPRHHSRSQPRSTYSQIPASVAKMSSSPCATPRTPAPFADLRVYTAPLGYSLYPHQNNVRKRSSLTGPVARRAQACRIRRGEEETRGERVRRQGN